MTGNLRDELMIRSYLTPTADSFWRWDGDRDSATSDNKPSTSHQTLNDGGRLIVWRNGMTLAFREELVAVLQRLQPCGLPALDAVLLVLAATRKNWNHAKTQLFDILAASETGETNHAVTGGLETLEEIHRLGADVTGPLANKCVLAEMIFADNDAPWSRKQARDIAEHVAGWLDEAIVSPSDIDQLIQYRDASASLASSLGAIAAGFSRVRTDELQMQLQTGLPNLPSAAEIEVPVWQQMRQMLTAMRADRELGGIARVAMRLLATITIPRRVDQADELPLGGVSDITNRGPLDRLLTTELAHDDLTLAVRVAVNEALYLRREAPPQPPQKSQVVLLESGIRTWGVPRVFAIATALALSASKDSGNLVAYRAQGESLRQVDLTRPEGIADHLQTLELDIHPGPALAAFADVVKSQGPSDQILIISDDVFADPEFQAELNGQLDLPVCCVTVNRQGRYRLLERTTTGTRQIKEATLDLSELLAAEDDRPQTPLLEPSRDNLPAIFSVQPFPLLLSHPIMADRAWHVNRDSALALTKDGRLMGWGHPKRGATQLSDEILGDTLCWYEVSAGEGWSQAITYSEQHGHHLVTINLKQSLCTQQRVPIDSDVTAFCQHNGSLMAVLTDRIVTIDKQTAQISAQGVHIPDYLTWKCGRFFQDQSNNWHALSHDGFAPAIQVLHNSEDSPRIVHWCDRPRGPVGVTDQGDLYDDHESKPGRIHHLEHPASREPGTIIIERSCPHGRWVEFTTNGHRNASVAVEIDTRQLHQRSPGDTNEPFPIDRFKLHSMRHRFTSIGLDDDNNLTLCGKRDSRVRIELENNIILLRKCDNKRPLRCDIRFAEVPDTHFRFSLMRAEWADESAAWLDSRGLLHLKSSNTTIPELTIVLSQVRTSGWCSNGFTWGSPYFVGSSMVKPKQEREIFESILKPIAMALPHRLADTSVPTTSSHY